MRLGRIFIFTFTLLALFFHVAGLPEANSKKPIVKIKMASLAPDGLGWAVFIKDNVGKAIKEETGGDVILDLYLGGVMGDDEDYIMKMRIDQLQGAGFSTSGAIMACPEISVFALPFIVNDFDEVDYIRSRMKDRLIRIFEEKGFRMWFLADQAFDIVFSTKREVRTPEDFAKSRFVTWVGSAEHETLKALGNSPIPMNVPEIPSSVRSGILDALLAPPIWYVGTQLYTVTKYVTPTNLRYSPGAILITKKTWDKIPQEYHEKINEIVERNYHLFNEYGHYSNRKCLKAMVKYGLKEVKLTPDEIDLLKKKTRPVWDKLAGKLYPRDMLDEVLDHLRQYRSQKVSKLPPLE
ncbi:MAG: TRAP transporter substrate-binding protein DctP [Thermodesulfobacteriota bacterium]|nr:TRAP transporter substrate-binding protein DctP [Thermodesulfobacteriota bacterium]